MDAARNLTGRAVKLQVEKLAKHYGEFTALSPSSLDVHQGEFLTLLGPSGSGKTTLLMMVAGLVVPSGGEIRIDGRVATSVPPSKRDIGMVFQNYALFPHLTVFENIAFPLRMRRVPEAQIRKDVMRVLEMVELPHVAERVPRALSGGQQQRIALARCIVYAPSIILMDEPLGALDKRLRDQLQIEIKNLHKSLGTTILYVTHDQQETLTMSDRICLMNHGRIEQVGTPTDLYFTPKTEFGAAFLGESNILPIADVTASDGGISFTLPLDGHVRMSAPHSTVAPADAAKIMLRPEWLSVTVAPPQEAFNSVRGKVADIIFTGEVTRYFVSTGSGTPLAASQLTRPGDRAINVGDDVYISWPRERTYVLAREGAAA
ncbi:ABC transporter ATP-binding protein [Ancylobacter sp. MQZ15Z-1]|uniref:Spermidine/putrescine import ATP-binding protein PotA n=1 Tax=Ancylobacter mangrovi TaxID=2972472 RepID=A0A9X2T1B1_9HYPH|nr:ABC transporter ATP-binding protein [Ancylobacter mangrovi]MCS0494527.1 ABC transporter ATP-binding protein [Ancylobacter mangrovi]